MAPKSSLLKRILAAGQRENHAVVGHLLGRTRCSSCGRHDAVAAADQEEVPDRPALDGVDHLVGHAQHRVMAEAHQDRLSGSSAAKPGAARAASMTGREIAIGPDVRHARPGHQPEVKMRPGSCPWAAGCSWWSSGSRRGRRELLALILPSPAVVAHQVRILLQGRIGMGGKHFAVGVDVDPLAARSA